MKSILVPTDFSGTAENALNYAIVLAKQLNGKLILLHAYQVAIPFGDRSFEFLGDERKSVKEECDKKLKTLGTEIRKLNNIELELISVEGDPAGSILETAEKNKTDLVIIGTTGVSALRGIVFGSVSLKIMEKAACPVMVIPPDFSVNKEIKRITYATDYHRSDLTAINKAAEIAAATRAQLNILHISDAIIGVDEEKTLMRDFMEKVKNSCDYNNLSFQVIHSYNVEEKLAQYIDQDATDMLMMSTHYRDFLDKLFGKSVTKNITRKSTVPVVAFHHNAKTAVILI